MVRVRLKRTGARNAACFRVVVMDQRSSRDGKAIEELGYYDPISKQEKVNVERADYWKSVGAQFTETVTDIVERVRAGKSLKDRVRKPAVSKKAKAKAAAEAEAKAKAAEEAKAAAEAAAKAAEEAKAAAEAAAKAAEEAKTAEAPAAETPQA